MTRHQVVPPSLMIILQEDQGLEEGQIVPPSIMMLLQKVGLSSLWNLVHWQSAGEWHLLSPQCSQFYTVTQGERFYKLGCQGSELTSLVCFVSLYDQHLRELDMHARKQLSTDRTNLP